MVIQLPVLYTTRPSVKFSGQPPAKRQTIFRLPDEGQSSPIAEKLQAELDKAGASFKVDALKYSSEWVVVPPDGSTHITNIRRYLEDYEKGPALFLYLRRRTPRRISNLASLIINSGAEDPRRNRTAIQGIPTAQRAAALATLARIEGMDVSNPEQLLYHADDRSFPVRFAPLSTWQSVAESIQRWFLQLRGKG